MEFEHIKRLADMQDLGQGEYGATTVAVTKDGTSTRIAFGRNTRNGPAFYVAVQLAPEALGMLKAQLAEDGAK